MKTIWPVVVIGVVVAFPACVGLALSPPVEPEPAQAALNMLGVTKGIVVVLNLPAGDPRAGFPVDLARGSELIVYFQSDDAAQVAAVRREALAAGLLGKRIFADQQSRPAAQLHIHMADNLADGLLAFGEAAPRAQAEALRVLRPGGKAWLNGRGVVKPAPAGTDDWSHPYHGPDNNPQSADQLACAPYLTQFVAPPAFAPMSEVTVSAGGRIFRAYGHIAFREYQNPLLNTLLAINAYNGAILWQRPLKEGFMIHRNTMIATADTLYLADNESCKVLDAASGQLKGEIVLPAGLADGPVWKWMALEGGRLYALVGGQEFRPPTQRGSDKVVGGWPWAMWPGYDYRDPKTAWGFGRTFVAIDPATRQVLWHHREDEHIDGRGVCMRNGRIYYYSPQKFLACLDVQTGKVAWKNSDADLLAAIGPHGRAQGYILGFATTAYLKATDKHLLFAGPQRPRLVAASTADGKLLWQKEDGNFQLVLRDDAIYAAGRQGAKGFKLDYETGKELAQFIGRRACTRATGSADSVFFRTGEGTIRYVVAEGREEHIAPMRPPCHSGVIVSNGLLYWGPWICGCRLALFGHICLGPAGRFDFRPSIEDPSRLEGGEGDRAAVAPLEVAPGDWPGYRASATTDKPVAAPVRPLWTFQATGGAALTAAVTTGETVFVGGQDGLVHALNAADGTVRWRAFTGAAVLSPPAVWKGRLFVGSGDGWVYAFEATTGRLLWRFRLAPAERRIPVYGRLMSTWPVAGGVAVRDGVVYAAAGIAHYDGTYVAALDGVTGKPKWGNDTSGRLSPAGNGVSVHGPVYLEGERLCFAGGNVYPVARYDLQTGKCLNEPQGITALGQSLFHLPDAIAPARRAVFADGSGVIGDNRSGRLAFYQTAPAADARLAAMPQPTWAAPLFNVYRGFLLGPDGLLVIGTAAPAAGRAHGAAGLAAVRADTGAILWRQPLPAAPVENGLVIDAAGRIIVSLADGRLVAWQPSAGR